MRVVALTTLALAGCYNPAIQAGAPCGPGDVCPGGLACIEGVCGGSGNGGVDASVLNDGNVIDSFVVDGTPLCQTWTPEHFAPCTIPQTPSDLVLDLTGANYTWDTDTGELRRANTTYPVATMVQTQVNGPTVRFATVNNFSLAAGATLDVVGSRPLLIAVWGTANIAGFIDASADTTTPGPGGNPSGLCTGSTGTSGVAGTPATGGGGGGFRGRGGNGGNGGGAGGATIAMSSVIRGGCAGGLGPAGQTQADRGDGGGAIQITARQSITIASTGSIHVGGGGGSLGDFNTTTFATGGGAGGGSGGYIGLDAPTVTVIGRLAANGGGGGGGSSDAANGTGGSDGRSDNTAATGGPGAATGTLGVCASGGAGSVGATLTGANAAASGCGGGGGGGGAGYIYVWSPAFTNTGTVTPSKTDGP